MHGVLYVCIPRSEARTSLQARRKVCKYLTAEGFDTERRFSGHCDYFSVGGRYSGRLALMRLRDERPKAFARFWKSYWMKSVSEKETERLFRKAFPQYQGELPINRESVDDDGAPDDAQIMDGSLFRQLSPGFGDGVDYSYDITEPNVICTEEGDDFQWPATVEEAAKLWVVVIDYHF